MIKGIQEAMPDLVGNVIGSYHIKQLLGRGGMSEVYLAYDEAMEREVAVKVMTGYTPDYLERFRREAEAIDKLQHEHILPAYDYEDCEPWHFLVMMYVPGGTLRDLIDYGPLPPTLATRIFREIADAVQFAHDHGILHRDIKPSNVLLGEDHYAYLADFGLAKILENTSELTRTGILMGTPEYMAPDLANGPATASTDIYALGVVLYQMLTGHVPFDGETPISVYWKHLREVPLPPSRLNPALSPAIDRVVLRALAKDPVQRYASAQALSQALEEALAAPEEDQLPVTLDEVYAEMGLPEQSAPDYGQPMILEDSASFPEAVPSANIQVTERPGRRFPFRNIRRREAMTSRNSLFSVPVRRRRRRVTASNPMLNPDMLAPMPSLPLRPLNESDPDFTASADVDSGEYEYRTYRPRRRRLVKRETEHRTHSKRMVLGIILTGIFVFVILPLGYIYYIYATRSTTPEVVIPTQQAQGSTVTNTTSTPNPVIFQDSLASNSQGLWTEVPGRCFFEQGAYHSVTSPGSIALPCALASPLVGNAAIQVGVTLHSSPGQAGATSAGLIFRMHGEQSYDFRITNTGQFFFLRHDGPGNQYTTLVQPTKSSAIIAGSEENTLLVIATGSDFKLYINSILVSDIHDTHYSNGQIALTTGTISTTNAATGDFTHLQITRAS